MAGKKGTIPPHPRKNPYEGMAVTVVELEKIFGGTIDFAKRQVELGEDGRWRVTLCYVVGMVRMERVNDYLLRPMAQEGWLAQCATAEELLQKMKDGALYTLGVELRHDMATVVADLIEGNCALFVEGVEGALSFQVGTEEKRSIMPPTNETVLKGSRDTFVESIRTNTSLVRRHMKSPTLRITEEIVGRQSVTQVDIVYLEGITNPNFVTELKKRLQAIDLDVVLATGQIEEFLVDKTATPFPLIQYTERPDRFCEGLAQGRGGILIDGLPLGYLVPATLGELLRADQDQSNNWMLASVLTTLRYFCMLITLFLPALYVAVVTFHQEMIPTRLALSILNAKKEVPFATVIEVLILLLSFETIQEAGIRLPQSIGQTVSIIGGLVVGTAAVSAKIVSPVVLVVMAVAGIAGYTMPSQDMAGALRIWRFLLTLCGCVAGLFGVTVGGVLLVGHLASLESYGTAYLSPIATNRGDGMAENPLVRPPIPTIKFRPRWLGSPNRRSQG